MEEIKALNDDMVEQATGGSGLRDHPMYEIIKAFYRDKGITSALNLAAYYGIIGEERYEMMNLIQEDLG